MKTIMLITIAIILAYIALLIEKQVAISDQILDHINTCCEHKVMGIIHDVPEKLK